MATATGCIYRVKKGSALGKHIGLKKDMAYATKEDLQHALNGTKPVPPASKRTIKDEVARIGKLPFPGRIAELKKAGIIRDVYRYGNRPVVTVNINGVAVPFYRSSQGTSGKEKGKWFPFFGFGLSKPTDTEQTWLIKPSIKELNNHQDNAAIAEYSNIINSLLNWEHSMDLTMQNPFFNADITFKGDEAGFNKLVFGKEDLGVVNDGWSSYAHIDSVLNKLKSAPPVITPTVVSVAKADTRKIIKTEYFASPDENGSIPIRNVSSSYIPDVHNFKLLTMDDGTAKLEFINNPVSVKKALESPHQYIYPIMDETNSHPGLTVTKSINISNVNTGSWKKQGDHWVLVTKPKMAYDTSPDIETKEESPFFNEEELADKVTVTGVKPVRMTIYNRPSAAAQKASTESGEKGLDKAKDGIKGVNRKLGIGQRGGKKHGMTPLSKYKSILQRGMTSGDSASMHMQALITEEITAMILQDLIRYRKRRKGALSIKGLKGSLKINLEKRIFMMMQEARPSIQDLTYDQWKELGEDHPDMGWLEYDEIDALGTRGDQYEYLMHAFRLFDIDEIEAYYDSGEMSDEELHMLSNTTDPQTGKPVFFIGFANLAFSKLAELNIVKAINTGDNIVNIEEDTGNYTQRFNDSWSLMINPKDTLGHYAKVILNTVPDINLIEDANGIDQVQRKTSLLGFGRYMKYDAVFSQVIELGLRVMPQDFGNELMNNPFYDSSPVIRGLRLKLQEIREQEGVATFNQVIQQLATTMTSLKTNNLTKIFTHLNTDKDGNRLNMETNIVKGAKQKITGQIVLKWQGQFLKAVSKRDWIVSHQVWDDKQRFFVSRPQVAPLQYEVAPGMPTKTGDFADFFKDRIEWTMKSPEFRIGAHSHLMNLAGYTSIARDIRDVLGIELIENDWEDKANGGYNTAIQLRKIHTALLIVDKTNVADNFIRRMLKKDNIKSFSEFINRTFTENIANQVRVAVKGNTFDQDEPFKNSTTATTLLANMFQHFHQNVVNPQGPDIFNKNQYIYVPSDLLNHEIKRLQTEEQLSQMDALPISKYDYHMEQLFKSDPVTGKRIYTPQKFWTDMGVDVINGMAIIDKIKNKGKGKKTKTAIEARSAPGADIALLSMMLFTNEEVSSPQHGKIHRGQAKYFIPFGDSVATNFLNFEKYAFDFDYADGHLVIKPGQMREIIYGQFKSELNRAHEAYKEYDKATDSGTLRKGYHYFDRGTYIIPGAATRMYYFGREMNELTENHPLFETYIDEEDDADSTEYIGSGLHKHLKDEKGELNDVEVRKVFDGFIDDFFTGIINDKLKQLEPFEDAFFDLQEPVLLANGKYASPLYKTNIFDNRYMNSIKHTFLQNSTVDGKVIRTYQNPDKVSFDTPEQANQNGMHMQILKAVVIDHQINAFMANTLFRKITWDFAAFDKEGSFDQFMQNLGKRESAYQSPFISTASNSVVHNLIYRDVQYGHAKVERKTIEKELTDMDKEMLDFLEKHLSEREKAAFLHDGVIPERYIELTAVYHTQKYTAKASNSKIAKILKAQLKSKLTDGGTIITLREYLFQKVEQGVIDARDFGRLYKKFSDPNLVLTEETKKELLFKGQKMVGIGTVFTGDSKSPVYIKDAKMVLIPAQVKGTRYESILKAISAKEDTHTQPSPGIQLVPESAAKIHSGEVFELYDDNGNYVEDNLVNAKLFSYPRSMYGEQVQNPDKKVDQITQGSQLMKYMFDNIPNGHIFAIDKFTTKVPANRITIFQRATKVRSFGASVPEQGISKLELRDNMVDILKQMHEVNLQNLVNKYGLDYDISDEWKKAAMADGYYDMDTYQQYIDDLEASDNYEDQQKARDLNYRKYGLIVRTIHKLANDIREQAYNKKGVEISQLRALNEISIEGEGKDRMERFRMSLTYTPSNKQYQQIVLAEIQKLFAHTKLHGFGGIQVSSVGHEQVPVRNKFADKEGWYVDDKGRPVNDNYEERMKQWKMASSLKGYGLKYDETGKKVIGFSHAEIGVPWNFKDSSGKLLDYDTYVNEDGTPKEEMFDDEMLHIIAYRIPNTGLNMAGRFKIARFFKPGYTDAIMIPDILYAQMGTDLDFDKLYSYLYNHTVDMEGSKENRGKITKVKGVVNMRQVDANDILHTKEGRDQAVHSSLMDEDPGYKRRYNLFKAAFEKLASRLDELEPVTLENEETDPDKENQEDNTNKRIKANLKAIKTVKANLIREAIAAQDDSKAAVAALEKQFEKLITDFQELQDRMVERDINFNLTDWLAASKNNYLKAQTYQQLENAYMDVYHIIMSDMDMLPAMLTPLTSDLVTEQINSKEYDGRSIAEMEGSTVASVPNSESYQVKVHGDNHSADQNLGALANASSTLDACQTANLSVGKKMNINEEEDFFQDPVVFLDDNDYVIVERADDPTRFVTAEVNKEEYTKGYRFTNMVLHIPSVGKTLAIPYRLARIYGVDGTTKVSEFIQSLLQSFLDFNNDRGVAHTNINLATLNAAVAMATLGYTDHTLPFMEQEVLRDFTRAYHAADSPFMRTEDPLYHVIKQYMKSAGLHESILEEAILATEGDIEQALTLMLKSNKLGTAAYEHEKYFSVKSLKEMIVKQYKTKEEKDSQYHIDQLHVLNMFIRLRGIGKSQFELMQAINMESKGFKSMDILSAVDQIKKFDSVAYPFKFTNLIGSERLGPWNKDNNPRPVHSVYSTALVYAKKGMGIIRADHNMFSDLTPLFEESRKMLAELTGKDSVGNQGRFNIGIIKYLMSNPRLYSHFIDDDMREAIPGIETMNAHELRSEIFIDPELEVIRTLKPGGGSTTHAQITKPSLARRMDTMEKKIDETTKTKEHPDGITYGNLYPILNYFHTSLKNDKDSPSWIYTTNVTQFKERIGQEMPFQIATMLRDSNKEIRIIAKMLYLYYYLGSGVQTSKSFGQMLPQEELFTDQGFADAMTAFEVEMNRKVRALKEEIKRIPEDYDKPEWFKMFDELEITINEETSKFMLNQYTQHVQNNTYDVRNWEYVLGVHFDNTDVENVVELKMPGKVGPPGYETNPPSFIDKDFNVYVINRDYKTYTRVNRAGLISSAVSYSEYNLGERSSGTLLSGNQIRIPEEEKPGLGVAERPVIKLTVEGELQPMQMDVENKLTSVFQQVFYGTESRDVEHTINRPKEEQELQALAESIFPMLPEGTIFMGHSIREANKRYQPTGMDGYVTLPGTSTEVLGYYQTGNPNGKLVMAYEYIDLNSKRDPLLLKKVLLHESAHAVTVSVFKALERLEKEELTVKQVYLALGLDEDVFGGRGGAIQSMAAAYKKHKELFEYLKTNPVFTKAYLAQFGKSGYEAGNLRQLGIIMSSVEEFTARLFNDKQLRDALKAVPYDKKTVFDQLLDFLKEILGLIEGTAAHEAFGNLLEILEPLKGSRVATEGYRQEDVHTIFAANDPKDTSAMYALREMYKGVSNFDSLTATPEELLIYDRLVKDGKIIC